MQLDDVAVGDRVICSHLLPIEVAPAAPQPGIGEGCSDVAVNQFSYVQHCLAACAR